MVFERQDLQRVRLAAGADPMWELALGVQKSRVRQPPPPFVGWRQECDRRLARGVRTEAMSPLRDLVLSRGAFPDTLTPPGLVADIDAGCEAVFCTPRHRLREDLAAVFAQRVVPTWVRSLAAGDQEMKSGVVRALRAAHDLLIAPHWAELREVVAADHAVRTLQLAGYGVNALLANIPGVLNWDGRVLRMGYPVNRTVYLRGRGLVLQPSYFCWGSPVTWIDPELPPVLVFPVSHHQPRPEVTVSARLVALLGRTRAECLRVLLAPRSTTELAERLGTSVGTASKQATVLRETGLVTSDRHGAVVLHSTTSLGLALLIGDATER
ncbi:winged helix-turn-helix domain-containing protein [Amycolatopsis sp. DG1A-15b]|uniref:ArsR/SmtB family transcription factor n=1 Tax=Amycolatopsis sp. DG1A-15b TaxID=3052846 RepID=UPI00255B5411|nr:winged helix-turn-helix domain-containing protein [Amycolatopsis sp. DG1A-15b]WIX90400.1 winged helix-turn-helix domain-containing protein [Amycolatopsis sp. DG1A-15b]